MGHSWLLGGLTGFAVLGAATAIPFLHRGANSSGSAAAATTDNPVAPHYRVPVGSPIPNPVKMPGHLRPYQQSDNPTSSGASYSGLHRR